MRANLTLRDYEQISAYLDGQLSVREKARFEQQLREQPDLKTAYDEMSRTRTLLRMTPHRRAPRNFTLTHAMVQQSKPKRSFGFNLFPALSFASALAALLLVATILFELMPGMRAAQTGAVPEAAQNSDSTIMMQEAPALAATEEAAQKGAAGAAPAAEGQAALPPVITWGFPQAMDTYGPAYGKGGGPGLDIMGRGGGGGGDVPMGGGMDLPGMGGGAPDGNLVVPFGSVEAPPEPSSARDAQSQQNFEGVPTIEGTGPILGIAPTEQGGQFTAPLPTQLPDRGLSGVSQEEFTAQDNPQHASVPVLRWVQYALGAVALIAGVAALLLWRRAR